MSRERDGSGTYHDHSNHDDSGYDDYRQMCAWRGRANSCMPLNHIDVVLILY